MPRDPQRLGAQHVAIAAAEPAAAPAVPTAVRIIETAERLFAEHGLEGVSLRQIAAAAGQKNKFAVQYHFGSTRALLKAIVAHRIPRVDAMRESLLRDVLASDPDPQPRALLDVLFRPLAAEALHPDSRYVSFISSARFYDAEGERWWRPDREALISPLGSRVSEMILDGLGHLPKRVRISRFRTVVGTWLRALAAYETGDSAEAGAAPGRVYDLPFEVFLIDLLDTTALALAAPLSPAASQALKSRTRAAGPAERRKD